MKLLFAATLVGIFCCSNVFEESLSSILAERFKPPAVLSPPPLACSNKDRTVKETDWLLANVRLKTSISAAKPAGLIKPIISCALIAVAVPLLLP